MGKVIKLPACHVRRSSRCKGKGKLVSFPTPKAQTAGVASLDPRDALALLMTHAKLIMKLAVQLAATVETDSEHW